MIQTCENLGLQLCAIAERRLDRVPVGFEAIRDVFSVGKYNHSSWTGAGEGLSRKRPRDVWDGDVGDEADLDVNADVSMDGKKLKMSI